MTKEEFKLKLEEELNNSIESEKISMGKLERVTSETSRNVIDQLHCDAYLARGAQVVASVALDWLAELDG